MTKLSRPNASSPSSRGAITSTATDTPHVANWESSSQPRFRLIELMTRPQMTSLRP